MRITIDEKTRKQLIQLCKDFLDCQWKDANDDEIVTEKIEVGFANRTYYCALKDCKHDEQNVPNEVVVKLYGNELVGKKSLIKVIGESAEAVVLYKLSLIGLAPKLFGVFDGGRIEEYLKHTPSKPEHFRSKEMQALMAKKLAIIHKLDMPLPKVPKYFDTVLGHYRDVPLSLDNENDENVAYLKALFAFPLIEEIKWTSTVAPKIGSRITFCHNDYNLCNVVMRENEAAFDDRVYVLDFETCGYNYRGFDIGYFIQSKHIKFVREKEETITDFYEYSFTEEEMQNFLESYLNEWKRENDKFDPSLDTIENLEKETMFFGLQDYLIHLAFAKRVHNRPQLRLSLALSNYLLNMYNKRKEQFLAKYGDPLKW